MYTDEVLARLELRREELEEHPACEVGNIFTLGMRFSDALGLLYTDGAGTQVPVYMGSYGIGPARLLGVVVEMVASDTGMVLPAAIAPFDAHLLVLGRNDAVSEAADDLYAKLTDKGVAVLYDDRDVSAGEKFAESDVIGIPHRLVLSDKTHEAGKVEYIDRTANKEKMLDTAVEGVVHELSL